MTTEAIKEVISALPEEDRDSLAEWIHESAYDDWDNQMVRDLSPGGAGMGLVDKLRCEMVEGKTSPMEDGFASYRKSRT